jgi:hypothetical protein
MASEEFLHAVTVQPEGSKVVGIRLAACTPFRGAIPWLGAAHLILRQNIGEGCARRRCRAILMQA